MRIISSSELSWRENKLYFRDRFMAEIYPDKRYKEMFWIEWYDKSKSSDFYNLSRSKDHAMNISVKELNKEIEDQKLNTQGTPAR